MSSFKAVLDIIGVNPFVFVPERILKRIFKEAGADRGPIQVRGTVNGKAYAQTLIRYKGEWRLYINTNMLKNSPKRIGEKLEVSIDFDPSDRIIEAHPKLVKALNGNPEAKTVFEELAPSRRKEIVRYIAALKSQESIDKNIARAIDFLLGRGRFVGRERP